ncbi:MAG: hypothetical protein RJQ09_13540 [Cyclobacteriaceae bacterium]
MLLKRILIRVLLFVTFSLYLFKSYSQTRPLIFGEISEKDLEMTVYEKDSSAGAIVLANYGSLNGTTYKFKRNLRIKILRKTGYEFANQIINIPSKSDVKGFTYNLENGEVVKTELDKESIFEEEVFDDYYILRIFMPDVKVGSVIELEYTHFGLPFEWRFQETIPVVWSELHIEETTWVLWEKIFYGYEQLDLVEGNNWAAYDVPAIKPEPLINNIENYLTKFEIEVTRIYQTNIATDWDAVSTRLMKSGAFGDELRRLSYLKKQAKEIKINNNDALSQLQAAVNFIKEEFDWDGNSRIWASTELPFAFKGKEAVNSTDINLSLIVLLRHLGFETYPAVLSTRENGILSPAHASLRKLNYVIAYLNFEGEQIFLDATDKNLPIGMLPKRVWNGQARVIDETKNGWIDMSSAMKSHKEVYYMDLTLNSDAELMGKVRCTRQDHAALDFRNEREKVSADDELVKNIEENYTNNIEITNYQLVNVDDISKPLIEEFEIEASDLVDDLGTSLLVSPIIYGSIKENPFKSDERKYPIDIAYPISKSAYVTINLEDGVSIDALPEAINMSLPDNSAKFIFQAKKIDASKYQVFYKFDINKPIYFPSEYHDLKKFYEMVVNKLGEQFLIQKKT